VLVTVRVGGAEIVEELELVVEEEVVDDGAVEEDEEEVVDEVVALAGAQSLVDDPKTGRVPPTIISFLGRFEFCMFP